MSNETKIKVRSKFWATAPVREVSVIDGKIFVNEHWFEWDYFFAVNVIVEPFR